ncbi:MAG: hypothetical protein DRI79_02830 [Chloroflexi bacterium]|nr:MAG: hypothetical protein DRI79_02830 [Chloroflexota bacterium]
MTLQEIIADIHAMDRELQKYEDKYGLRSQYFYELYTSGKLRDEDPDESREYGDWAACYEIKMHREQVYDEMIQNIFRSFRASTAISLSALKPRLLAET